MTELTIIFIVVAFIAWVAWTAQKSKQALDKDALDQAWREVLVDPHYIERRHYEERMRVEDEARAAAAKRRVSDRAGSAEADSLEELV
jgi:hypothetical protein